MSLTLVSLALVVGVVATWRLVAAPSEMAAPAGVGNAEIVAALARSGERLAGSPLGWAADALASAAFGDGDRLAGAMSRLTASTLFVAVGAFVLFARTAEIGTARLRAAVTPRLRRRATTPLSLVTTPLSRPLAALVVKEWLTIGRDLRRLSGALWPLGMFGFYAVALARDDDPVPIAAGDIDFWLAAGPVLLLPWGLSLGTAIYAFGSERRNVDLLRALPISARGLLLGKLLASLLPIVALTEAVVAVVAVAQGATGGEWLGLAGLVLWAAVGYVTIDTVAAALAPNFETDQIQRATGFAGRLFGFVAGGLFTLTTAAAAVRLILLLDAAAIPLPRWLDHSALGWPLAAVATGLAALTVAAAFRLGERRVTEILRTPS